MVQSPCLLLLLVLFIGAETLNKHLKWEKLGTSDKSISNANDVVRPQRTTYLVGSGDGDLRARISEANSRLIVIESTLFRIENILKFLKSGSGSSVPQSADTINEPVTGGTLNVPQPEVTINEPLTGGTFNVPQPEGTISEPDSHQTNKGAASRSTKINGGMDFNHFMNMLPMYLRGNGPNTGMFQPHHYQAQGMPHPQHFQAHARKDLVPLTVDKSSTPRKVSWMDSVCSEPCGVPNIPRIVRHIRTILRPLRDAQAHAGTAGVTSAAVPVTDAGANTTSSATDGPPATAPPSVQQKPGPAPGNGSQREARHRNAMNQMRVVGGVETLKHKYPWQVYIQIYLSVGGVARCGGSIINDRYVLTAGHCMYKGDKACSDKVQPEDVTVTVAEHNINSINDDIRGVTDRIDVRRIICHPKYCTTNIEMDNDIALLRLAEVLYLPDIPEIGHVCLPGSPLESFGGMVGTIAGWGYKEEDYDERDHTDLAYKLQEVNIKIHPDCSGFPNPEDITPNMICAGDPENIRDACGGDSGGPLVVERNGKYTLAGLVSFGPEGGDCTGEGVYVKVTNYLQWIKENTMDAGC